MPRPISAPRFKLVTIALCCAAGAAACTDRDPAAPTAPAARAPRLMTATSDERLRTLVVELTGPELGDRPLLYNITLDAGRSEASLRIPAGPERRLAVRAYDAEGRLTHQGEAEIAEVREGENEPLATVLRSANDKESEAKLEIDVVGQERREVRLVVRPELKELSAGQTVQLRAEVYDREGKLVEVKPGDLQWAVSDPGIAAMKPGAMKPEVREIVSLDAYLEARRGGKLTLVGIYFGTAVFIPLRIIDPWVAITAGFDHSCTLRWSGAAYCWGGDDWGQLGVGTVSHSTACQKNFRCELQPTLVAGNRSFSAISAGAYHTCALSGGDAYCWGNGEHGQMGNGTQTKYNWTPVAVSANGTKFVSIDAGGASTCALTSAGDAWCWGDGISLTPTLLATGVTSASPGTGYRCVTTTAPRARCVGQNAYGQLGDFSRVDRATFVNVFGNLSLTSVTAGNDFACALYPMPYSSDNAIYCWGDNDVGQLGNDGGTVSAWCAVNAYGMKTCAGPELIYGTDFYKQVEAGGAHACAITTADAAVCWGSDSNGQLGNGTGYCSTGGVYGFTQHCKRPVVVAGGMKWSRVAAGGAHSCGIVAGSLAIYCWGAGSEGQIGDGAVYAIGNVVSSPVKVLTP